MSISAVVARFQCAALTAGQKALLEKAHKDGDQLLVLLGIAEFPGTKENMLDFPTRQSMVLQAYPNAMVVPLPDCPTDEMWSAQLDKLVGAMFPTREVLFYHSRDSFVSRYSGKYKTVEVAEVPNTSATDSRIRTARFTGRTEEFRAGAIHQAMNNFDRVFPVVDVAITKEENGSLYVLLGRKRPPNGTGKLCFPGGFVEVGDETIFHAAAREAFEETGLTIAIDQFDFVTQIMIPDWRATKTSKVMSTLLEVSYDEGTMGIPKAGDDLDSVEWVKVRNGECLYSKILPSIGTAHQQLFKKFCDNR